MYMQQLWRIRCVIASWCSVHPVYSSFCNYVDLYEKNCLRTCSIIKFDQNRSSSGYRVEEMIQNWNPFFSLSRKLQDTRKRNVSEIKCESQFPRQLLFEKFFARRNVWQVKRETRPEMRVCCHVTRLLLLFHLKQNLNWSKNLVNFPNIKVHGNLVLCSGRHIFHPLQNPKSRYGVHKRPPQDSIRSIHPTASHFISSRAMLTI
jgi:hypothetical protein